MSIFDNKNAFQRLARAYPKGYINMRLEFIAHPQRNSYFPLLGIESEHQLNAKVVEHLSREAVKGGSRATMKYHLDGLNLFLGTNFNSEDVETIYSVLGNGIKHLHALRFVRYGFDMRYFSIFHCFKPDAHEENTALAAFVDANAGLIPVHVFPGQEYIVGTQYWDGKSDRPFWVKRGKNGKSMFRYSHGEEVKPRPLNPATDWELTTMAREEASGGHRSGQGEEDVAP